MAAIGNTLLQGLGLLGFVVLILFAQTLLLDWSYARRTMRDGAARTACHGDDRPCESVDHRGAEAHR